MQSQKPTIFPFSPFAQTPHSSDCLRLNLESLYNRFCENVLCVKRTSLFGFILGTWDTLGSIWPCLGLFFFTTIPQAKYIKISQKTGRRKTGRPDIICCNQHVEVCTGRKEPDQREQNSRADHRCCKRVQKTVHRKQLPAKGGGQGDQDSG